MEKLKVLFYGDESMEKKYIPFLFRDKYIPEGKKVVVISDHHYEEGKDPLGVSLEISKDGEIILVFCSSVSKDLYYRDIKIARNKFMELISRKNVVFLSIPFNKEELRKKWADLLKRVEE